MRRPLRRLGTLAAGTFVLLLVLGWLVLKSPLFLDYRKNKVVDLLNKVTPSEVTVAGNVSVTLGRTIRVQADELSMPLGSDSESNVLSIGDAQIGLFALDLLKGKPDIREFFSSLFKRIL